MEKDRGKLMKESEGAYIRELQKELTRRKKLKTSISETIEKLVKKYIMEKANCEVQKVRT